MSHSPFFHLRERLAVELRDRAQCSGPVPRGAMSFGVKVIDLSLGGGLSRAALHEFYAKAESDAIATTGIALGLAAMMPGNAPILWVRQDYLNGETGHPYPAGLAMFGIDPGRFFLVKARNGMAALKAGAEAARCSSLAVIVLDIYGERGAFDLTISRRLFLAAKTSGVTVLVLRSAARPTPSAAETRWQVTARPSLALAANTPGNPAFAITLLRHRNGVGQREWFVEWNRDKQCFETGPEWNTAPLSQPMVSISPNRASEPAANLLQRAR